MQKEGIVKPGDGQSSVLYFDLTGIRTFLDLTASMVEKVTPGIRKKAIENYLKHNEHDTFKYKTKSGLDTNIWDIHGSEYNLTEYHIAEKLAKSGQHVLFPNQGDLGKGTEERCVSLRCKNIYSAKG